MRPFALLAVILIHGCRKSIATSSSFLEQGFQFDYTPTGQPVPIPTTTQCESIHLSWGRAAFTTGPNPVAPYIIQVYTSTFTVPFVVDVGSGLTYDWPVPFIPGTQYQICMFDANGVTGGCLRSYTVVPAPNSTTESPPGCANVTAPTQLDVDGMDHTGELSQYGWVDQCTDISIKPKNGTPPFTLTIAPTLHPPWNITSPDMSPINWTVQLSWSSQFFLSLVDSQGNSWSFGPMHSGGEGPTNCLSLGATSGTKKGVSDSVTIGVSIGTFVFGWIVGLGGAWLLLRKRRHIDPQDETPSEIKSENLSLGPSREATLANAEHLPTNPGHSRQNSYSQSPPATTSTGLISPSRRAFSTGFEIDPIVLPQQQNLEGSRVATPQPSPPSTYPPTPGLQLRRTTSPASADEALASTENSSPPLPSSLSQATASRATASQVYVVHHDGGRAPVSVYTPEGTEVIELPPRYEGNGEGSNGRSGGNVIGNPTDLPPSVSRKQVRPGAHTVSNQ